MQLTRSECNISLSYPSSVSIKGNKTERLKNCNGKTASGFALFGLPIHKSRHGYGFPVDTFGMSKESNKHFFIVPKSLYHIFASGNTRSI